MKVAVVHNLVRGGAWRRLYEQVSALDADVVEVTTSAAVPVTDRPFLVSARTRSPGLPPVLRPPFRYLDSADLAVTWRELADLAQRAGAEVIYANPDSLLKGAMPLAGVDLPVLRYCDEPRRIDYQSGLRSSQRRRTRALYAPLRRRERRLDRDAIRSADALVTNSRFSARGIQHAYGRSATVLRCGVSAGMRPRFGAAYRHVLSVGSMIAAKGHDLVLRAVAHSGLSLPVVVVSPNRMAAEERRLRRIAADNGVRLDIRVGIDDAELIELYQTAYATMYLSAAEPLGLVSLEAQACGSPVIVADEGGLPETIVPGRTGFAVRRAPADAADALRRLLDRDTRHRISAAAAAHGAAWTWADSARELRDALARLVRVPGEALCGGSRR